MAASNVEGYTLPELVDLALCTPEVGAVNFNILRVVLLDIVGRIGGDNIHPHLDDLQQTQIHNYKEYIEGNVSASPMPGVLNVKHGGMQYNAGQTPRNQRKQQPAARQGNTDQLNVTESIMSVQPLPAELNRNLSTMSVAISPDGAIKSGPQGTKMITDAPRIVPESGRDRNYREMEKKVERLERHLDALYQLPTNQQFITGNAPEEPSRLQTSVNSTGSGGAASAADGGNSTNPDAGAQQQVGRPSEIERNKGMSVNDMWQIIQLNNRVAATEAGIQKMASLIEDLAKELKIIKKRRNGNEQVSQNNLGGADQVDTKKAGGSLNNEMGGVHDNQGKHGSSSNEVEDAKSAVEYLKNELEKVRTQWNEEMETIRTAVATGQGISQIGTPNPGGQAGTNPGGQVGTSPGGQVGAQTGLAAAAGVAGAATQQEHGDQTGGKHIGIKEPINYPDQFGNVEEPTPSTIPTSDNKETFKLDPRSQARIGAAEASIKKMNNIIEELTKELKNLKKDKKPKDKDGGGPQGSASGASGGFDRDRDPMMAKMEPIKVKCEEARLAVDILKEDIENIKNELKNEVCSLMQQCRGEEDSGDQRLSALSYEIHDRGFGTSNPELQTTQNAEQQQAEAESHAQAHGGLDLQLKPSVIPPPSYVESMTITAASSRIPVDPNRVKVPYRKPGEDHDMLSKLRSPFAKAKVRRIDTEKERFKLTPSQEKLLQDEGIMMLLPKEMEILQEKVRAQGGVPDVFDEMEILEKMATLWEGVDVVKRNQELLALKVIQVEGILKSLPAEHIEMLQQIPLANLEVIANVDKHKFQQTHSGVSTLEKELSNAIAGKPGIGEIPTEDIQAVFNNLNSLLTETEEQREKLEQLSDQVGHLEEIVVTKPMLVDCLMDKADKSVTDAKVSMEDFITTVDDLTSKLQNLLIEVYQKNEGWKRITDKLMDEMGDKLDKFEIGPLRAYFKSHLGDLETQVNSLVKQLSEPDPAGTRRKILRDYNCISCDRHTNISGKTNSPTLPCIGPSMASPSTASQRALDMCSLRVHGKCDPCGDKPERQSLTHVLQDAEVANLVNRYVGGSHTAVSNANRLSSLARRPSTTIISAPKKSVPPSKSNAAAAKQSNVAQDKLPGIMGGDGPASRTSRVQSRLERAHSATEVWNPMENEE